MMDGMGWESSGPDVQSQDFNSSDRFLALDLCKPPIITPFRPSHKAYYDHPDVDIVRNSLRS